MKYQNKYGEDRTPISQKEAEKGMKNLIDSIHKDMPQCTEKSFWLTIENEMWTTYADSVKHNCTGKLVKEFLV